MKNSTVCSAFLFFIVFFWVQASFSHGKCSYAAFARSRGAHEEPNWKWLNEQADYHEDALLLKTLYSPWYASSSYELLLFDGNGNIYNDCIGQHSKERKREEPVKLNEAFLNRIKYMLEHLNPGSDWQMFSEPKPGQWHTVLVFNDGKAFHRYDFNDELPAQVQEVIRLLRSEMEKQIQIKLKAQHAK